MQEVQDNPIKPERRKHTAKAARQFRSNSASNSASNSGSNTATITGSSGSSPTGSSGSGSGSVSDGNSTSIEYDPRDPAGGISMITPAAIAGSQFFKVGDYVTFAWNYTSLSATPTAVNVIASCSKNDQTYTLAANTSAGETGSVVWDTSKDKDRLLTEKYTLIVYDAASGISATPRAGYLGGFNQYIFALYTPQPYESLGAFRCATCNSAMSTTEKLTLKFLLGTVAITVLSFTWFAQSFSIS